MTLTTEVDVSTIPPIGHVEGAALGREEYRRFADVLAGLSPEDWARPTDCTEWDVRALAGHVVGAMRSAASIREMIGLQRAVNQRAAKTGESVTDAMTAIQVERTAGLSVEELVAECRALVDPAAAGRRRTPWPVRRFVTFPVVVGSISERWTLGYLVDVILTRDIWLHRVDLTRAVGTEPVQDGTHDARIVADVVVEWARRHGRPFHLVLTGPAGGTFRSGTGGPDLELTAVEFCRIISGRAHGEGLLAQEVPF